MKAAFQSIPDYISNYEGVHRERLDEIYSCIKTIIPEAKESFKYGMPTFEWHGNLVHFAAMKHHIGFYPAPSGISNFTKELEGFVTSKGAIQFPLDKKIPKTLVKKIVLFRKKENEAKIKLKTNKK
jgi:uncharacterized protein YdhG (YjbR/CyaY superfamily)